MLGRVFSQRDSMCKGPVARMGLGCVSRGVRSAGGRGEAGEVAEDD